MRFEEMLNGLDKMLTIRETARAQGKEAEQLEKLISETLKLIATKIKVGL